MLVDWHTSSLPSLIPAFENNGAPLDFFRCSARGVAFVAKKESITDIEIMILQQLMLIGQKNSFSSMAGR